MKSGPVPRPCAPRPRALLLLIGLAALAGLSAGPAAAQPLRLVLPTSNDAVFVGGGPAFYQYTERNFEGRTSYPWEGGQYGFVRNAVRAPGGIRYTRFHEGVDIRPIYRDEDGEPLDTVRSIDDGRVVYTSTAPGASNYGRYVVVEHTWQGCAYYTLYAHLARVHVYPGQLVARGQRLATLGYSGNGLDQRRAHLHFEVNLFLSDRFEAWHRVNFPRVRNEHGRFNGQNMAGFSPSELLVALRDDADLDLALFLRDQPEAFAVAVPGGRALDIVRRYPWLAPPSGNVLPGGWEIAFTGSGFPIGVTPLRYRVLAPSVVRVSGAVRYEGLATNGLLARTGQDYRLSARGLRFLDLVTAPSVSFSSPSATPDAW